MARALDLARRGIALAHPNPVVGAVLVEGQHVIGEGFHVYDNRDHAEILALKQAGRKARGATLYVTLEPCCIMGRTGPCTKAIIAAEVKRVVAAMKDPNPAVAGRGVAELKRARISVHVGSNEAASRTMNEDFAKWIRTGQPFVTLKTALTLDGKIAAREGSTTWITSEASREEVQGIRHAADALLTGIGTVLADDPRMSDRTGKPRRRRLMRAVVDSRLRLPLKSTLVKSAEGDVMVSRCSRAIPPERVRSSEQACKCAGSRAPRTRGFAGRDPRAWQARDFESGDRSGRELNGAALEAGIVDKMILFYAPKIMGNGVPMAQIAPAWFAKSPALTNLKLSRYGPDLAVEGYLHDVYGDH